MEKEERNIEMHAEAGHYEEWVGTGNSLQDIDRQMIAGIALGDISNGMGDRIVNEDGSLIVDCV